jgi:hypothetical protein
MFFFTIVFKVELKSSECTSDESNMLKNVVLNFAKVLFGNLIFEACASLFTNKLNL